MFSNKLKLVKASVNDDILNTDYACNVTVELAGDSIWGCTLSKVTVTGIRISEYAEGYKHITVMHNGGNNSWRIYSDSGFEAAISNLLGETVMFTEQGMQADNYASME